jgi:hypothetical protein
MSRLFLFLALAVLAGCATATNPEPVNVVVSGPKYPSSVFACKEDAIPPDPTTIGDKAGSAAARYESAQRAVAADCRNKLHVVGAQERAAGNVIVSESGEK